MKKILILAASCMILFACNDKKEETKTGETKTSSEGDKDKAPPQSEFADAKYVEWGKKMIAQFTSGDMDGYLSNYADNAVYAWSAGHLLRRAPDREGIA